MVFASLGVWRTDRLQRIHVTLYVKSKVCNWSTEGIDTKGLQEAIWEELTNHYDIGKRERGTSAEEYRLACRTAQATKKIVALLVA